MSGVYRTSRIIALQALAVAGVFALGTPFASGAALAAASPGSLAAPASALIAAPASQGPGSVILVSRSAADIESSKTFISGMAQRAIDFLADQSLPQAQKSRKFKELLASSFDLKTIGRFALGRYWRTSTPAQQKEYQALFEKMVVEVYSNRFKDYKGQKLIVDSAKPEGEVDVIVTSYITPDSGPRVRVDWRVRNTDGRHKIVDIIVEGVSMAVTQRSEFASVIQAGGGDISALLNHLRK